MTVATVIRQVTLGASSPGNPLFFDDFDYTLDRVDTIANKLTILQAAGWANVKDTNGGVGARGYVYTVNSIEGFAGTFPGASGRALCLEAIPISSGGSQSDFYVQYGAEPGVLGTLPADVWFQYWVYLQRDAGSGKVSASPTGKFLYALHGSRTSYPEAAYDTAWLFGSGTTAYDPADGSFDVGPPETGAWTYTVEANPIVEDFLSANAAQSRARIPAQDTAGQVHWRMSPMEVPSFTHFRPNRWYLMKTHMNVSATGGAWEMWAREKGTLTFTKMADFRNGVYPSGFTYNTFQGQAHPTGTDGPTTDHDGPRILRMPTTAGSDYWKYLADFAIASSEGNLPTYGSY